MSQRKQQQKAAKGDFTGAIAAQKVLTAHQRASKANICLPAFVNLAITHMIPEEFLFRDGSVAALPAMSKKFRTQCVTVKRIRKYVKKSVKKTS